MSQGIILAGGFSSRAKSNKMHFIVDGKPILIHTIESLKPFVNKLIVVTGYYDSDIRLFVKEDDKIRIVYNKDFQRGMFSSVLTGVKEIKEDFFIIPGDIPFVSKETFEKLLKGSKPVRYPVYENKEGHPLFIAKELIKDDRVLVTCDDDNIGSAKVIENNGGILENKVINHDEYGDEVLTRRYWIKIR